MYILKNIHEVFFEKVPSLEIFMHEVFRQKSHLIYQKSRALYQRRLLRSKRGRWVQLEKKLVSLGVRTRRDKHFIKRALYSIKKALHAIKKDT